MEIIKSSGQFGELVRAFKKEHKGSVQSNCFFLPAEVEEMTEKKKLYFKQTSEGLYFLVREEECGRLYYYMDQAGTPSIEPSELFIGKGAVILDYVFRGEEGEALRKGGYTKWLEKGFKPYKKYRRMECMKGGFHPPKDYVESEKSFQVEKVEKKEYREVTSLWKKSLDVYSTFILEEREFEESCKKGEIISMKLPNGKIFAATMAIKRGKTAFLQHLAVEPELRGNGMGKAMFCAVVDFAFDEYKVEKANFWVDEANSRAIGMYVKSGFVNDGTFSSQFILEKRN